MAEFNASTVVSDIRQQQKNQPLHTLLLAEPILASTTASDQSKQSPIKKEADVSVSTNEASTHEVHLTPSALAADLEHYQSLFSKLRFSYLEQVTKEKYLRSIVGDPPVLVSHEENVQLESKLVDMKSDLKSKKEAVRQLVEQMEALARHIAQQNEQVNAGLVQAETLPLHIQDLEEQVAQVKAQLQAKEDEMQIDKISDDPRMNHTLDQTQTLLDEQVQRCKEIDEKIAELQRNLPGKIRECERTERELEELENQKMEVTRLARELKRVKDEGGRDMLEEQGRWYKNSEIVLNALLETES